MMAFQLMEYTALEMAMAMAMAMEMAIVGMVMAGLCGCCEGLYHHLPCRDLYAICMGVESPQKNGISFDSPEDGASRRRKY